MKITVKNVIDRRRQMLSQKGEKHGTNIEVKTTLLSEQVLLQPPIQCWRLS